MITLKDLIKDNKVYFDSYRAGFFYYNLDFGFIHIQDTDEVNDKKITYQFTVPADDIGNATLLASDKAITFMRWIKKAVDNNELIKINK